MKQRIDLRLCLARKGRLTISPRVNKRLGMGNKCYEVFYFIWFALTRGYCICFDEVGFGNDVEIYHLLLESFLPPCPQSARFYSLTVKELSDLEQLHPNQTEDTIFRVAISDITTIWPLWQLRNVEFIPCPTNTKQL
jgi:hypothetical protein